MEQRLLYLTLLVLTMLFSRCAAASEPPSSAETSSGGFVAVSGLHFIDGNGRPLLLHGINIINKSQSEGYTKGIEQSDLKTIRSWGMNCIRLGILWDGLEPAPGKIDEKYLDRIARIVGWAKGEGLYVLLDMHQDLYSVKFSDGAPAWATLDGGKSYTPTAVWSDAYFVSEAVQTALDHFWSNSPVPDGVGLQDHYSRVWRCVAERFRDEPAVLGYDLMNEPYPGRDNARNRLAMVRKLVELLPEKLGEKRLSPIDLAVIAGTPDGRKRIATLLNDSDLYSTFLTAGTPIMQAFERERLQPMYARVRRSIRSVDSRHIIFLEPATSSNIGIVSAIAPLIDKKGCRDPHQAYAPHAYDLVTDNRQAGLKSSNVRIELIMRRHAEKAREFNMPLLIGEWGAYYEDPSAVEEARFVVEQFSKLQCGDTYWAYRRTLAKSPLLNAIERRSQGDLR